MTTFEIIAPSGSLVGISPNLEVVRWLLELAPGSTAFCVTDDAIEVVTVSIKS